jgi:hypothetical protein
MLEAMTETASTVDATFARRCLCATKIHPCRWEGDRQQETTAKLYVGCIIAFHRQGGGDARPGRTRLSALARSISDASLGS